MADFDAAKAQALVVEARKLRDSIAVVALKPADDRPIGFNFVAEFVRLVNDLADALQAAAETQHEIADKLAENMCGYCVRKMNEQPPAQKPVVTDEDAMKHPCPSCNRPLWVHAADAHGGPHDA